MSQVCCICPFSCCLYVEEWAVMTQVLGLSSRYRWSCLCLYRKIWKRIKYIKLEMKLSAILESIKLFKMHFFLSCMSYISYPLAWNILPFVLQRHSPTLATLAFLLPHSPHLSISMLSIQELSYAAPSLRNFPWLLKPLVILIIVLIW